MATVAPVDTQPFSFGSGFLEDHAGHIMRDTYTAIVELIANAYDAGATTVSVSWPDQISGVFSIEDNGTGMTPDEFALRWKTLGYRRIDHQGAEVKWPAGAKARARTAFGQSGKGRHGAFCFSDKYSLRRLITSGCVF
jgi:hypothetical protein